MFKTIASVLALIVTLSACGDDVQVFTERRILMDTLVSISIYAPQEPENWREHVSQAFEAMQRIEALTTSYNDSSEIGTVNLNAGQRAVQVSPEVLKIIRQAREVSRETHGAFDISVLPLLQLWNFKSAKPRVPTEEDIADKLHLVDFRRVVIDSNTIFLPKPEMGLDLGAIAKGYAVDRAVAILKKAGYMDIMVEAGGDLRTVASRLTRGERKIWVRHPRKSEKFFAFIRKDQCAVATSGDYERFFEINGQRFHHILDPSTGYPAGPVVSVTIFAEETAIADAYATAVFVLGPDKGIKLVEKIPGLEGLVVFKKESENDSILDWKVSKGIAEEIEIVN